MADDQPKPEDQRSAAIEAATEAAVETAAVISGVEQSADAAIEAANERAELAERTAEQIAAGALESERARQVSDLERNVETWRNEQTETRQMVTGMQTTLAELSTRLEQLTTHPQIVTLIKPPSEPSTSGNGEQSSLNPDQSRENVEQPQSTETERAAATLETAVALPAEAAKEVVQKAAEIAAPRRRNSWI